MEKNKTEATSVAVKEFSVLANVSLKSFEDKENKTMTEYLAITLVNPFPGEEFADVSLSPKWDRDKAIFKFKSRRVLASRECFDISGIVKLTSYKSKRTNKMVSYPAIYINNPFDETRTIEFVIKNVEKNYIFSLLCSELWDESLAVDDFTPYNATAIEGI